MDLQQRQIALRPARRGSKKHAILGRAVCTSFMSLYYGTFFIFEQEGKEDVSIQNCIFIWLKRYNEVGYVGEGALLDQYSRLCLAIAVRGTFLSISTPLQTYVLVMAELFCTGASFLALSFFVFSNHRRCACVTEEHLVCILHNIIFMPLTLIFSHCSADEISRLSP